MDDEGQASRDSVSSRGREQRELGEPPLCLENPTDSFGFQPPPRCCVPARAC